MKLPDAIRRAIRTAAQAFTGVILFHAGTIMLDVQKGEWVPDVDWLKRVGISAIAAGFIAAVTFIQNWSEDKGIVPSVLKATASSGKHPVTRDAKT